MRYFLLFVLSLTLSGCSGLFFYPERQLLRTPARLGLAYQDVYIETAGQPTLHGWWLPARVKPGGKPIGTILFLHGNAENISTHIHSVAWLPAQGFNVLLFDYRGYGTSQGKASIAGVNEDAERAIGYALSRPDVDPNRFVVFGQSLGASVAIYAVAHSRHRAHIEALVAESAFYDYKGIAKEKLAASWLTWLLQWPVAATIDDTYSPIKAIPKVSPIPVLLIHGDRDPIVPVDNAERLFRAARQPKRLWIVHGGGHIQAFAFKEYRKRFVEYLTQILEQGPAAAARARTSAR
ncbi:MAG: alpha/beta hydrolase [Gammaproteobacteria bacterium]